jgi:hypothetical protein
VLSAALNVPDAEAATTVKVQLPIKEPEVLVSVSAISAPEYADKVAVLPAAPEILNTPDIIGVLVLEANVSVPPTALNTEACDCEPFRDTEPEVEVSDPKVPPVTTAVIPVVAIPPARMKEIFAPGRTAAVLIAPAVPPAVEVATTGVPLILWKTLAVFVVPETVVSDTQPRDVPWFVVTAVAYTADVTSGVPSVSAVCQITNEFSAMVLLVFKRTAFATGVDTTVNIPAVRADAATSAIRCLIVFIDICFLSLVRLRIS